jgi:uncharacterized delta-60 repeat protein
LDLTFTGDGLVITFVNPAHPARWDTVHDLAFQSNGKILAVGESKVPLTNIGDFALARYTSNGALDPTFSGDGRLITNLGGLDRAYDVAIQPNGKIIVSGEACNTPASIGGCDLAVVRYNPSGIVTFHRY